MFFFWSHDEGKVEHAQHSYCKIESLQNYSKSTNCICHRRMPSPLFLNYLDKKKEKKMLQSKLIILCICNNDHPNYHKMYSQMIKIKPVNKPLFINKQTTTKKTLHLNDSDPSTMALFIIKQLVWKIGKIYYCTVPQSFLL